MRGSRGKGQILWVRVIVLILATLMEVISTDEPDVYTEEELNDTRGNDDWRKFFSRPTGRIVGGRESRLFEVPFMVSIQIKEDGSHFCGGSIYNTLTVITAAHCFFHGHTAQQNVFPSEISIIAGETDFKDKRNIGQRGDVTQIILFPGYRINPGYNDVAILKLKEPLKFSTHIFSIRIADEGEEPRGVARVFGFGYSLAHGLNDEQYAHGFPNKLYQVDLEIIDKETCKRRHEGYSVEHAQHPRIICAGGKQGKDSCQGDSGGPLVCVDKDKKDYLCGIVQAGFACGLDIPGFYTKVVAVRNFIRENGGKQARSDYYRDIIQVALGGGPLGSGQSDLHTKQPSN